MRLARTESDVRPAELRVLAGADADLREATKERTMVRSLRFGSDGAVVAPHLLPVQAELAPIVSLEAPFHRAHRARRLALAALGAVVIASGVVGVRAVEARLDRVPSLPALVTPAASITPSQSLAWDQSIAALVLSHGPQPANPPAPKSPAG